MPPNQSYSQRFLQKMALTPQMRQSLAFLGMPAKDLAEYIDLAMTKNPFLRKLSEKKPTDRYRRSAPSIDGPYGYEKTVRQSEDPRLGLLSQIRMSGLSEKDVEIAEHLIFEMDDNGYILTDLEEAASGLGVTIDDIERCLSAI